MRLWQGERIRSRRHARPRAGSAAGHRPRFAAQRRQLSHERLDPRWLLAAEPFLSELVAQNVHTLTDADGQASDWLEIGNRGDQTANLNGYYLTNNPARLTQWRLPDVSIPPGGRLVVFASGKDRAAAGSELHTSFSLANEGGFLALVAPDGATIVSQFAAYPALRADEAYGVVRPSGDARLVDGSDVRILVPTNNTLGTNWTGANEPFNDTAAAGWRHASGPVGYDVSDSASSFTVDVFYSTRQINNLAAADSAIAGNNLRAGSPRRGQFPTVNFVDSGGNGHFAGDVRLPGGGTADNDDYVMRATTRIFVRPNQAGVWTFGFNSDDGGRLRIDGRDVIVDDALHAPADRFGQIQLSAGSHQLEFIFFERGGGSEAELFAAMGSKSAFDNSFTLVGDPNGALPLGSLDDSITTDIESSMRSRNASAYLRYPFTVSTPQDVQSLTLEVTYDDGFVAYLNGTQVASANAPANLSYNSTAAGNTGLGSAKIDLTDRVGLLRSGTNVLAIQGLNASASDDEFFIDAKLTARVLQASSLSIIVPTPEAPNGRVDPIITEFLASNRSGLEDEDGDTSDWIEIHNPGVVDVPLTGWYLTDDAADLTKWRFPSTYLQGGEYLVVFASGKDRRTFGRPLHTNFRLDAEGEHLALVRPDGRTAAWEYEPGSANYRTQFPDVSYGLRGALVPDTGEPDEVLGVAAAFSVRQVNASASFPGRVTGQIGGDDGRGADPLADADLLLSLSEGHAGIAGQATFSYPTINFFDSAAGGDRGLVPRDEPFPLDDELDDDNYFALKVTATLIVPAGKGGDYRFAIHSDEGARLRIDGANVIVDNTMHTPRLTRDTIRLAEGEHELELVYFEREGGAELELLYAPVIGGQQVGDLELLSAVTVPEEQAPSANILYAPRVFFPEPSPGRPNDFGVEVFVGPTTFSVEHGFYDQPFSLAILNETPGVEIWYTLNGTEPGPNNSAAKRYDQPLSISQTTVVRAAAFLENAAPSKTATATYLFLDDIVRQSPNGQTPPGFPSSWGSNVRDYGMDPDIVNSATWGPLLDEALKQIPSMSLVMDTADLFGSTGIYSHASQHGRAWERPASLELIDPNGTEEGFQANTGVRIRGGFSRSDQNPKHAFRFFFRQEYGDAKLEYPLFGDEGTDEFDKIDLATSQNYSWAFQGDNRNNFLRDIFSRDMQGAMGQPYKRGRFYHLYINGQYWGLYNTDERAEARFAASYLGGDREDYDVVHNDPRNIGALDGTLDAYRRLWEEFVKPGGLSDANMADYYRAQGMNPDGTRNPGYERLLDVDNLIDYMIITYYTSDTDGPGSKFTRPGLNNYFAVYNREDPDGWKFFEHDSEHSLDTGSAAGANYNMVTPFVNNGQNFSTFNAHWMHEQLATQNSDYRQRFIDRVTEVFADDGLFGDANVQRMLRQRADEIDLAIIGESARWGDAKRTTPFTKRDWDRAVTTTINWVRGRRAQVLNQFRSVGWYPPFGPPDVSPAGGNVAEGTTVTLSVPNSLSAAIFYTLDGSDPRASGGSTAASANPYNQLFSFVTPDTAGRLRVPQGTAAETGWQSAEYNDSTWTRFTGTVGYDTGQSERVPGFTVRIVDTSSGDIGSIATATRILNGNTTGFVIAQDTTRDQPYVNHGDGGNLTSPPVLEMFGTDREQYAVRATADVTIPIGTWTVAVGSDDGFRLTIPGVRFTATFGENGNNGVGTSSIAYSAPRGHGQTGGTFTVSGAPLTTTLQLDFYERGGGDSVELSLASGQRSSFSGAFRILRDGLSGWDVKTNGTNVNYDPLVTTDVEASMRGLRSSLYLRYPFTINQLPELLGLSLSVNYDDGIVVYLNGTEVARRFAADPLTFDSAATGSRNDADSVVAELINLNGFKHLLRQGQNVLAIHALNLTADNPDLLVSAELSGVGVGQPVRISDNTLLRARAFDSGQWSAIREANYQVNPPQVAITEINYNPHEPTPAELAANPSLDNDDFEFIEIRNLDSHPVNLAGVQFTAGIDFAFPPVQLAVGEAAVVVKNLAAFRWRYGVEPRVLGEFAGGSLDNAGERLQLTDALGQTLLDFRYRDNDPWPVRADGDGGTLVLIDPSTPPAQYGKYYRWRGSTLFGGSPSGPDAAPIGIVINEVLANTSEPLPATDSIELYNGTAQAIDLSGWYLSDSANNFWKYRIPDGTILPSGRYLVFDETDFNPTPATPAPNHFALNGSEGDDVWLVIPDGRGGAAMFADDVHFGATRNGESLGRFPNGTGRLAPMTQLTLGSANAGVRVGPVVISEVQYNPGPPSPAALAVDSQITSDDLEFVEIHNPTAQAVNLTNWRIRGGVDYDFSAVEIGPGETLVVVPFNPAGAGNANRLAAFRAHYQLSESVRLVGGYAGRLHDDSDRVQLQRPDTAPPDQPDLIPRVIEDEAVYDDVAPWPTAADGTGQSLNRRSASSYGNDGLAWQTGLPTPGSVSFVGGLAGDLDGNGRVDVADVDLLWQALQSPNPAPRFDLTGDGRVNTADRDRMILDILATTYGDANLDGVFNSSDLVLVFQVGEYEDAQPGNSVWSDGDWDADGDFTTTDLVLAFQAGDYSAAARAEVVLTAPREDNYVTDSISAAIARRASPSVRPEPPRARRGSASARRGSPDPAVASARRGSPDPAARADQARALSLDPAVPEPDRAKPHGPPVDLAASLHGTPWNELVPDALLDVLARAQTAERNRFAETQAPDA